jgi:hypothetical protein
MNDGFSFQNWNGLSPKKCPQIFGDKKMVTNFLVQICHHFYGVNFFGYKIEGFKLGIRLTEGIVLQCFYRFLDES